MTSKFLRSMYNKTIIKFGFCDYTNREITTTLYYVNSRRHVDSEKIWGSDFFRVYVSPRIYVI